MYIPWSNDSLERATQIIRRLSKLHERLQAGAQISQQEIIQAKVQLDELQSLAGVPGVGQAYQKYGYLLNPYWQSSGVKFSNDPALKPEYNFPLYVS